MFGTLIAGASASMLIGQVPGGFLSSKYPLCSGQESTLSVCPMGTRSEGECTHNKALVRCYMKSVDTSTCGISTESSSTITGSATIGEPSSTTTPETVDHTASTVQSTGTVTPSSSEHITSTRQTETNQQNQRDPDLTVIIIIAACIAAFLVVIVTISILTVLCVCSCYRAKHNRSIEPKVIKAETDIKESSLYAESIEKDVEPLQEDPHLYETIPDRPAEISPGAGSQQDVDCDSGSHAQTTDGMELKDNVAYRVHKQRFA